MNTPKLEPMTIRLTPDFHNELKSYSVRRGEFLYTTAERLLRKGLQIEKEKDGK